MRAQRPVASMRQWPSPHGIFRRSTELLPLQACLVLRDMHESEPRVRSTRRGAVVLLRICCELACFWLDAACGNPQAGVGWFQAHCAIAASFLAGRRMLATGPAPAGSGAVRHGSTRKVFLWMSSETSQPVMNAPARMSCPCRSISTCASAIPRRMPRPPSACSKPSDSPSCSIHATTPGSRACSPTR